MNLPIPGSKVSLPQISGDMKTMTVMVRHFLILSHAVPAARVRPLVPGQFALDTIKVNGETCAILQATCFFNENFHYTPLPKPSLDFWQATYRVLTRAPMREDTHQRAAAPGQVLLRHDPGVFLFHTFLGTRSAWAIQRAVASGAEYADFNVINRGDSYSQLIVDIHPQDAPPTQVALRAVADQKPVAPFADWGKMMNFLTYRPNSYYKMASLTGGENTGILPVVHKPMEPLRAELVPVGGEVREAKLGVWEKMGLLSAAEMRNPFAVLIQPRIEFVLSPPKLLRNDPLAPTRQQWNS